VGRQAYAPILQGKRRQEKRLRLSRSRNLEEKAYGAFASGRKGGKRKRSDKVGHQKGQKSLRDTARTVKRIKKQKDEVNRYTLLFLQRAAD